MHVCLFEDRAEFLEPLSLTRPGFELRCGITTLGEKLLRLVPSHERGVLVRPHLEELYRLEHPHVAVNDAAWLGSGDVILFNGCWLPPDGRFDVPADACVGVLGDQVAYVRLLSRDVTTFTFEQLPQMLVHWQRTLPCHAAEGSWISYPWDLIARNPEEIQRDYGWLSRIEKAPHACPLATVGPQRDLWVAPSARIEPFVIADTTRGPVVVDEEAVVSAFTRLEGPCYIGPKTQLMGARIRAGTTLGPQCRVGGEVEASIVHGFSNKYHEGFLGHSYIGEWVNLGAGTHNSDLRNDYGEITITLRGLPARTGTNKVGCFLGDHTKTGLGTLINTGTNVGAFCNLLPAGRFAPKYAPSFTSWWNGTLREAFTLDQLLITAQIAMLRRGVTLTEAHKTLYSWLLEETEGERHRVLRESEQRQLRRSA